MTFLRRAAVRVLWVLRPRYPLAWAKPFMRRKIRRQVEDAGSLDNAKLEMAHLLGPDVPDAELDRLARRYIAHWTWWTELRWHPRSIVRLPVEDVHVLTDAHARGRGVMLSMIHQGHWDALFASVANASGLPVPILTHAASIGSGGPQMVQHLRIVAAGGGMLSTDAGTQGMIDVLQQGRVITAAMDLPGRSVVRLGDREVQCSSGAVHAARAADSPLVAVLSCHDGERSYFRLVEVADHTAGVPAAELLQRLADLYHGALMAWPDGAYWPRALWPDAANADAAGA